MKIVAGIIWQIVSLALQASLIAVLTYFLISGLATPVSETGDLNTTTFFKTTQPACYFSILPVWYPDALVKLNNSPAKRQGIHLMRNGWTYKEWLQLQNLISLINLKKGSPGAVEQMRYLADQTVLQQAYRDHVAWLYDGDYKFYKKEMERLLFRERHTNPVQWLPTLSWWGTENRFHHFIFGEVPAERNKQHTAIASAFTWSFFLGLFTLLIAIILGTLWAYIMSKNEDLFSAVQRSLFQKILYALANAVYILPVFGIAAVLIPIFSTDEVSPYLNWFPGVGAYLNAAQGGNFIINFFYYLFFPAFIMSLPLAAGMAIRWHTGIAAEMKKNYIRSLFARGLSRRQIIRGHVMKNVALPMLWYLAMLIPALISGALIIENIFAIPGLGRLTFQSVLRQDIYTLLVISWCVALICLISAKAAFYIAPKIDPRIEGATALKSVTA